MTQCWTAAVKEAVKLKLALLSSEVSQGQKNRGCCGHGSKNSTSSRKFGAIYPTNCQWTQAEVRHCVSQADLSRGERLTSEDMYVGWWKEHLRLNLSSTPSVEEAKSEFLFLFFVLLPQEGRQDSSVFYCAYTMATSYRRKDNLCLNSHAFFKVFACSQFNPWLVPFHQRELTDAQVIKGEETRVFCTQLR